MRAAGRRQRTELLPDHVGIVEWFRPGEYRRVERVLLDMKRVGATRLRTGISWADWYTPAGISWFDWLLPRLALEVEILPCFLYTPPSIGIEPKTSAPPVRSKDYADFIDLFITRFGQLFEHVELWNEPNNLSEWDWTLDPHWTRFGEMIGGAAYWAKERGKTTVLGGMSPIDPHWLSRMFQLGVMDYIDVVGIHGFPDIFDYSWKGWTKNVDSIREILKKNGSNAEVWITEAGFSTWQHDEHKQLQVFLEFLEAPAERIYWYGIDDLDPSLAAVDRFHLDEREYFFGMRRADGAPKLLLRALEQGGVPGVQNLAAAGMPTPALSPERKKAVLVTGGAGFIGTNLVKRLAELGERVIVYDSLHRPGVEKNLLWLKERYGDRIEVEIADVRNPLLLQEAVSQSRHVFHLAAQVAVTTSLDNPRHDFSVNTSGGFQLLEAIRKAPEPPSLLFTSTNKVYGALDHLPLRRTGGKYEPSDHEIRSFGIGEAVPLRFLSPYGCSKGSLDQYVLDYSHSYGLRTAVFRMSCIYGPHQLGTEDQGWVAHFALQALLERNITLFGDGYQVRDILFVEDLVDAMMLAMGSMEKISGEPFNIGGGPDRAISLHELLEILRGLNGSLPGIAYDDWRTGDQRYYVSDTRKFRAITGWEPRVSLEEGVRLLYEWLAEGPGRKACPATTRRYGPRELYPSASLMEAAR